MNQMLNLGEKKETSGEYTLGQFLETIFGRKTKGYILVRFLSKGISIQQSFYENDTDIINDKKKIDTSNMFYNIHYGVCPHSEKNGEKKSVNEVLCLWADLDKKDFGGNKEEAFTRIQKIPIPTTICIDTGNGYHVYWKLKEPIKIENVGDIKKIESYNKGIGKIIGGDPNAYELSKCLRLPDTINVKDPANPIPVRIMWIKPEIQYDLSAFDEFKEKNSTTSFSSMNNGKKHPQEKIKDIIENCLFIRWTKEHQSEVSEPLWFAMVSNVMCLENGNNIVHEFSNQHPNYNFNETERKIKYALEFGKPHTCGNIQQQGFNCNGCSHKGKIKTPASLTNKNSFSPKVYSNEDEIPTQKYEYEKITIDREYIPQDGFLGYYMKYATPLTDSPDEYHISCAITCVASILGNSVFFQFGNQRVYPNLFMLLLGRSGFLRKSTAINIIRNIIVEVNCQKLILPDEITPESFIETLAVTPAGLFCLYEFGSFLKKTQRSYMHGFKATLTELYDCPEVFRRMRKEKKEVVVFEIKRPCISILSASTIEWFISSLTDDDAFGGFLQRFLFCPVEKRTKPKMIFPEQPDELLKKYIKQELTRISKLTGEYTLSGGAKILYEEWSQDNDEELSKTHLTHILESFFSRLDIIGLKLAMIIQASTDNSKIISQDSMARALGFTDYYKKAIIFLLENELTFSSETKKKKKVVNILKNNNGKLAHSILLKNSHFSAWELRGVVETLTEEGTIEEVYVDGGNKRRKMYVLCSQ